MTNTITKYFSSSSKYLKSTKGHHMVNNVLSLILGFLTIIVIWLIYQAAAIYEFTGTADSYNSFFCTKKTPD